MRTRRLAFRDDAFRLRRGGDAALRQYVIRGTDSPLPCQGTGQGGGFAVCGASVGALLTSILSPPARGAAENAAVRLNGYAQSPFHRCDSRAVAFSLLEVVLALGVAAFCLTAVLGLLPVGVQTNRNASSQTPPATSLPLSCRICERRRPRPRLRRSSR